MTTFERFFFAAMFGIALAAVWMGFVAIYDLNHIDWHAVMGR